MGWFNNEKETIEINNSIYATEQTILKEKLIQIWKNFINNPNIQVKMLNKNYSADSEVCECNNYQLVNEEAGIFLAQCLEKCVDVCKCVGVCSCPTKWEYHIGFGFYYSGKNMNYKQGDNLMFIHNVNDYWLKEKYVEITEDEFKELNKMLEPRINKAIEEKRKNIEKENNIWDEKFEMYAKGIIDEYKQNEIQTVTNNTDSIIL
jgi:hypothetical protein